MEAALNEAVGVREAGRCARVCVCGGGACGLFVQTASPNKCGQGSTAAVTEVVEVEREGGEGS